MSRAGRARMVGRWLLLGCLCGPALANDEPADEAPTDNEPAQAEREIERLARSGDGIALALAACEEVPQCVDGISEHEIVRMVDRIQQRIDHLGEQGDLEQPFDRLLQRYRRMRDRYGEFLEDLRAVNERVDRAELDEDWEDLLEFEVAAPEPDNGSEAPDADRQKKLERFQDAEDPLPLN